MVDCSITGFDDELLGETIQATIVLKGKLDQTVVIEKILQECFKNLSPYKIPQKIIFEHAMQMSATGKKIKAK